MGTNYQQLSLEERCKISLLREEGKTIRKIAAALARSPSSITREIKRNGTKTLGYKPDYAQQQAAGRRWRGSKLERQPDLRSAVTDRLAMGWSAQQVSNRLAQERGCKVISYESIYRFIYAQIKRTNDYAWRNYLVRRKSKRGWWRRKLRSPLSFFKDRISIAQRPSEVNTRREPGHWEADLMLFSKYGQALLAVHERCSRALLLIKLKTKEAKPIANQLMTLFQSLPQPLAKTVTFDNGTEFAQHHRLNEIGIKTYFCDVRSPWQKGGIENAIGRMRRALPRKSDLSQIAQQDLDQLLSLYNHTPRKCLGYKTPAEIFYNQLLHFKCEFTFPPPRE